MGESDIRLPFAIIIREWLSLDGANNFVVSADAGSVFAQIGKGDGKFSLLITHDSLSVSEWIG